MSVYYVLAPDLGLVKIGFADNARKRFSKIQSDSPARLMLLAIEEGDEAAEAARHLQFAEHRHRGEWFRYEATLRAHVEAIPAIQPRQKSMNARIAALGISKTHASQILSGKGSPSLPLAVAIWRETGWKHRRIAHAADADLEAFGRLDPWTPRARDEAA